MNKPFTKSGGINLYGCQICTYIPVFIVSVISGNGKIIRNTDIMFLRILYNQIGDKITDTYECIGKICQIVKKMEYFLSLCIDTDVTGQTVGR